MKLIHEKLSRALLGFVVLAALGACGGAPRDFQDDPVSRGVAATDDLEGVMQHAAIPHYNVTDIRVTVPRELEASEKNSYFPGGDIVWREDPMGDRHQQVADIVLAGLSKGTEGLSGSQDVVLDVEVTRFHALTQKARYTTGGVHAIQFHLTLVDAASGQPLAPTEHIRADFRALGGQRAIAAEAEGITQKVRIIDRLAEVIRQELTTAEGYAEADTGLFSAFH